MLTLTRKPEETIIIGEEPNKIEITVKEIRRNQVRIGIVAPDNVKIFRKELLERPFPKDDHNDDRKRN